MYCLECLFSPYDTRQTAEIVEKRFSVARNKRPQREGQRQTHCFARRAQFGVSARRLTDYNRSFYLFLFEKCSSRILSAFDKRRLWVLSNKRLSTIQYLILVLANKIVMMHRVTLCLLLEGTLEGQNCLLWCVFLVGRHPIKPAWKRLASLCHSWKYHFYLL